MRVISQRYPDIRIEGENYLPQPIYRHIASFLSIFKLVLIGLIIVGKDPFAFFGMQAPSIWQWGQENKVYACMMVFFLSNMIENQCMSTGAFEITLNDVPVWSKLESASSISAETSCIKAKLSIGSVAETNEGLH
ncbi:selenoprotein T precursor [Alligator mississippiensis]|uniref:Selenoprotein T n=1 Tax=Alligator mississippiensis TaxID=8496 RepID=A0A151NBV1_ALLMI|nr:selenoprotein T precursor [Alligator mississippiensis]